MQSSFFLFPPKREVAGEAVDWKKDQEEEREGDENNLVVRLKPQINLGTHMHKKEAGLSTWKYQFSYDH